jgi:hypothetical protein
MCDIFYSIDKEIRNSIGGGKNKRVQNGEEATKTANGQTSTTS